MAQYETRHVSNKKNYDNVTRQLLRMAESEGNKDLADFLRTQLPEAEVKYPDEESFNDIDWSSLLDKEELEKYL